VHRENENLCLCLNCSMPCHSILTRINGSLPISTARATGKLAYDDDCVEFGLTLCKDCVFINVQGERSIQVDSGFGCRSVVFTTQLLRAKY